MIENPIEKEQVPDVAHFLSLLPLFQKLGGPLLNELASSMSLVHLEGGETLIRQDGRDRTLFILWHGRLRVYKSEAVQAEISVGEIVGEVSLLTGEPRTATVLAIRDSVLIKLDHDHFKNFENIHPEGVARIAKTAINRLIRTHHPVQPGENTVTITVAPAGNSNHVPFVRRLAQELNKREPTLLVNAAMCDRHFNREVAQTEIDRPESIKINNWLTSLESTYRYILFETDHLKTPWTKRCVRQADMLYLVAEEGKEDRHNEIEEGIYNKRHETLVPKTVMVFVHPDGKNAINGTHRWLQTRDIQGYHHLHLGSDADFARLIRFITGSAFGLVLNGGGMRGFAHVGVLKALEELRIPIDYIGGCSIGAAIGATYARVGLEESINICRLKELPRTSNDYTFPAVALLKGKNVCDFYQKIYGQDYIEDLKTPFFCVSSDLTRCKLHVHEKGLIWEAVRASSSIPAVYPPMYDDSGGMLVDGALINNMPVDVMRKFLRGGKILAVDCNIEPLHQNKIIKQPWLSGWKLCFQRMLPFYKQRAEFDNIFKIIRTAFMFSSEKNQDAMKRDADYLIEIETMQFGVLKMQEMEAIIELGYRSAMEQLPRQLEQAS